MRGGIVGGRPSVCGSGGRQGGKHERPCQEWLQVVKKSTERGGGNIGLDLKTLF